MNKPARLLLFKKTSSLYVDCVPDIRCPELFNCGHFQIFTLTNSILQNSNITNVDFVAVLSLLSSPLARCALAFSRHFCPLTGLNFRANGITMTQLFYLMTFPAKLLAARGQEQAKKTALKLALWHLYITFPQSKERRRDRERGLKINYVLAERNKTVLMATERACFSLNNKYTFPMGLRVCSSKQARRSSIPLRYCFHL